MRAQAQQTRELRQLEGGADFTLGERGNGIAVRAHLEDVAGLKDAAPKPGTLLWRSEGHVDPLLDRRVLLRKVERMAVPRDKAFDRKNRVHTRRRQVDKGRLLGAAEAHTGLRSSRDCARNVSEVSGGEGVEGAPEGSYDRCRALGTRAARSGVGWVANLTIALATKALPLAVAAPVTVERIRLRCVYGDNAVMRLAILSQLVGAKRKTLAALTTELFLAWNAKIRGDLV